LNQTIYIYEKVLKMSPDGAKVWFIPDAYLATPADDDPV
jgi:hypothetical protein